MSDARLRSLERRWKETGDARDEARYLRERLRAAGLAAEPGKDPAGERVRALELFFCLLKDSLPMLQVLELCAGECRDEPMREALQSVSEVILQGQMLFEALPAFPDLFPPGVVALLGRGERNGEIEYYADQVLLGLRLANDPAPEADLPRLWLNMLQTFGGGLTLPQALQACRRVLSQPGMRRELDQVHNTLTGTGQAEAALARFSGLFPPPLPQVLTHQAEQGSILFLEPFAQGITSRLLFLPDDERPPSRAEDVRRFLYLWSLTVECGIPLDRGLVLLEPWLRREDVQSAVGALTRGYEEGQAIGQLMRSMELFPDPMCEMIWAAEAHGNLGQTFRTVVRMIGDGLIRLD